MKVVFKLGGSLLDLPNLQEHLQRLIQHEYANCRILVLVGGGLIVDAVRHYDSIHHFQPQACHWLCVELMNSTARMLQQLCHWPLLWSSSMLEEWLQSGAEPDSLQGSLGGSSATIVAPSAFYSQQLNSAALPLSWRCTSDSIAALLARIVGASQLVMLKSTDEASVGGEPLLDDAFASVVPRDLKVRIVNLRQ